MEIEYDYEADELLDGQNDVPHHDVSSCDEGYETEFEEVTDEEGVDLSNMSYFELAKMFVAKKELKDVDHEKQKYSAIVKNIYVQVALLSSCETHLFFRSKKYQIFKRSMSKESVK